MRTRSNSHNDAGCITVVPADCSKLLLVANGEESVTATQTIHDGCLLFSRPRFKVLQCSAREVAVRTAQTLVPNGQWETTATLTSPTPNVTDIFQGPVAMMDPTEIGIVVVNQQSFQALEQHFTADKLNLPGQDKPHILLFRFSRVNQLDGCNRYVVSSEFVANGS